MLSTAKSRKLYLLVIPALVILVTLGLVPVSGLANTYTIYPTADAVVYSGTYANTNFGNDTVFSTYITGATTLTYSYSYLKFDLSSIPSSERITGGTLYAYCYYVRAGITLTVQLRPVANTSWIESGAGSITWNNKPAYGNSITSTAGVVGWDHWTIPAANLPATGLVSFMLIPATVGGDSRFYSKENGSNKPYLQVTTKKKPQAAGNNLLLLEE